MWKYQGIQVPPEPLELSVMGHSQREQHAPERRYEEEASLQERCLAENAMVIHKKRA